jgi:hypothetical protein
MTEAKKVLIEAINKELDNCMRAKAQAQFLDTRDRYDQRIVSFERCIELIEGILP